MATGCMSIEEFRRNIDEFLKLSNQFKDGWLKETFEDSSHRVIPYVVKKNVLRHTPVLQTDTASNTDLKLSPVKIVEDQLPEDIAVDEGGDFGHTLTEETLHTSPAEVHQYEYHIIYSTSYHVPVLYFTASKSDGKLLSLDEVWHAVPEYFQSRLQHQRWTFITQQEHPYLNRPFFQLHPCHTADMMQSVLPQTAEPIQRSRGNYIVTWLSSVGPAAGLSLQLAYSELCIQDR